MEKVMGSFCELAGKFALFPIGVDIHRALRSAKKPVESQAHEVHSRARAVATRS